VIGHLDGHYDDTGRWKRTKFCFMSCGARCTCGPPGGLYYNPLFDKSHEQKELPLEKDAKDPMRGISMEHVRR
jgi:hypothetical protein